MGDYTISTDRTKMNVDLIHSYLSNQSYWAKNIPKEIVNRSIENSLCFGVFLNIEQVGFARVISDFATYAYIADVFILEPHRKKGLSKLLMQAILEHSALQGLRRIALATHDAHDLYKKFGFTAFAKPDRWMEKWNPDVYKKRRREDI